MWIFGGVVVVLRGGLEVVRVALKQCSWWCLWWLVLVLVVVMGLLSLDPKRFWVMFVGSGVVVLLSLVMFKWW
jgi:hypothetical protein